MHSDVILQLHISEQMRRRFCSYLCLAQFSCQNAISWCKSVMGKLF